MNLVYMYLYTLVNSIILAAVEVAKHKDNINNIIPMNISRTDPDWNCLIANIKPQYPVSGTPIVWKTVMIVWKKYTKKNTIKLKLESFRKALYAGRNLNYN